MAHVIVDHGVSWCFGTKKVPEATRGLGNIEGRIAEVLDRSGPSFLYL